MPKLRKKRVPAQNKPDLRKSIKNISIPLTRISYKDLESSSSNKSKKDAPISRDEINKMLASQSAILANKVPIYRRKVNLEGQPANDVYQFNFDAAAEPRTTIRRRAKQKTLKKHVTGISKRIVGNTVSKGTLKRVPADVLKQNIEKNGAIHQTTRASVRLQQQKQVPPLEQAKHATSSKGQVNKKTNQNENNQQSKSVSAELIDLEVAVSRFPNKEMINIGQSTSTPLIKRNPVLNNGLKTKNIPEKSPWRIQEEIRCPKTFYFSRSSDLTPSYASDIFPDDTIRKTISPRIPSTKKQRFMVDASFEANNSNAENICPHIDANKRVEVVSTVILKPPSHRSPLKQMEIIGLQEEDMDESNATTKRVSTLVTHSLTASKVNRVRKFGTDTTAQIHAASKYMDRRKALQVFVPQLAPTTVEISLEVPTIEENTISDSIAEVSEKGGDTSNSIDNVFGFDTSEIADEDSISTDDEQHNYSKRELKRRLKTLKRLAPQKMIKTTRLPCTKQAAQLFGSPKRTTAKRTNIREMFAKHLQPSKCSTPQRTAVDVEDTVAENESEIIADADDASLHLFNDPSMSEAPVINHPPRRSYSRVLTRKRKKVVGFEAVSDDESDSDAEEVATAECATRTRKTARTKRKVNVEETQEFKEFVDAMNKEFAEVEKYKLVIN